MTRVGLEGNFFFGSYRFAGQFLIGQFFCLAGALPVFGNQRSHLIAANPPDRHEPESITTEMKKNTFQLGSYFSAAPAVSVLRIIIFCQIFCDSPVVRDSSSLTELTASVSGKYSMYIAPTFPIRASISEE